MSPTPPGDGAVWAEKAEPRTEQPARRAHSGSDLAADRRMAWWLRPLPRWVEAGLLLVVLAGATALRLYLIGRAPPGPHYDEAANLLDALDVLDGRLTVFSPRSYGREMLAMYIASPLVALLGPTRLAVRLPVAIAGVLTIWGTYLLARELFGQRLVRCGEQAWSEPGAHDPVGHRQAQWTALLAALFLSLSFWLLAVNRIGLRVNYLPLTELFCFLFVWRALRTDRLADYVLGGVFLGLGLHTYIASRFVPVVLVLFFGVLLLEREKRELILSRWRRWMLLAGTALLIVSPLLAYFVVHPESFFLRASGLSIFNPTQHRGDPLGLWARSILGNLAVFGLTGDSNWTHNLPGRPGLDPVQAVLFWLGLGLCAVRVRQSRHLFLLIWWAVMLLPGVLAPDPFPHYLRAIGALPVAAIFAGRTAALLLSPLPVIPRRVAAAVPLVLLGALPVYAAWAGYHVWDDYFRVWLSRDEVHYAYYGYQSDLAAQINSDGDPEAVYLFPINYDRGVDEYRSYPLELLHQGPVPFHYIHVDEATVGGDLTAMCAGKRRVHLVVWTHGEHTDADPRQVLPFFLGRFGQRVGEQAFRGYQLVTYELPSTQVDFTAALDFVDVSAAFEPITLVSAAVAPGAASGDSVWTALRWRATQPMGSDYRVSLRLLDAEANLLGQTDASLMSNEHRLTSAWKPAQEVTTYHLLPVVPGALPATCRVEIVLYDPDTLRPLPVIVEESQGASGALPLGLVEIGRPERRQPIVPETALGSVPLAGGMELFGYRLDGVQFSPGETIRLALYWRASTETATSHTVVVQLWTEAGDPAAEWVQQPAYPTCAWQAGDEWRDWHSLRLAPDLQAGTYRLGVAVEGSHQPPAILGSVEIEGRAHTFETPPIGHPLALWLGDGIRLLGYDLAQFQVRAGESLHLTLYWQAVAPIGVSYTVFAHLLDKGSGVWGQKDGVPGSGSLPTTGWIVGEVVADEYEISVRADTPPGDYAIEIGMYEATTGQRLDLFDQRGTHLGDHLVLESTIRVAP